MLSAQTSTATPLTTTPTTNLLVATALVATPITHTFTVTNSSDSGTGSLRQAILNANADSLQPPGVVDVINFNLGPGNHTITLTSAVLDITAKDLTIMGTGAKLVSISGGRNLEDFKIEAGANVTISGLTITEGSATVGGGINNAGHLTLNNDILNNNIAVTAGGGIFNSGTLIVNNSVFSNNNAVFGGGLENIESLSINSSSFTNNAANSTGGGIYTSKLANVSGLVFSGNQAGFAETHNVSGPINFNTIVVDSLADSTGGQLNQGTVSLRDALNVIAPGGTITFAAELAKGEITLTQGELALNTNVKIQGLGADKLTISGNKQSRLFSINTGVIAEINGLTIANGVASDDGGGILNRGTLTLMNDMLIGNSALSGGAIFNSGNLTLLGDTFSGNAATYLGGAVVNNAGILNATNITFSGNRAGLDGGALWNNGTTNLLNDTIAFNQALNGGGIRNLGVMNLHDTLIAKNTALGSADIFGDFGSQGFNLIGTLSMKATGFINGRKGDQVGTDVNPIDPKLGVLKNNGGTTFTHALLTESKAINLGDPTNANNPKTDQRGIARPQRSRADIGAFELV